MGGKAVSKTAASKKIVGVLALQGDFHEHAAVLTRLGVEVRYVRLPDHLVGIERLIIPGGESTTIGMLMQHYQLLEPIRQRAGTDLAVWGTCAGAILLARTISEGAKPGQPLLGLVDMVVRRNGFGRQRESFECDLTIPVLGPPPFRGVFIRAPVIEAVGPSVEVLARLCRPDPERHPRDRTSPMAEPTAQPLDVFDTIVAARAGRILVATFHPELTPDDRFHRYFLEL